MLDAVENTPELKKCNWMLCVCVLNTRRAQTPWVIETKCGEND